jgi:uncharacterized protein involved in tolerance to divalent cations
MWILTDDKTMINTDKIIHMDIEETDLVWKNGKILKDSIVESKKSICIKALFNVSSGSSWSDRTYTNFHIFCILDSTEENKNTVKRIFNEIFDSTYSGQKTFNIPKRLLGKN